MVVVTVAAALLATLVAGALATALARQWAAKRRHHALAWAASLYLFAGGTLAVAAGVGLGWDRTTFGTYWITGALLTVPFLAVGQLHLLAPQMAALWWTVAGLFAAWAVFGMAITPVDAAALAAVEPGGIPVGRDVYGEGVALALLRPANWLAAVVVGGSIWSGLRTRRYGVLAIALGVVVAGGTFTLVRAFDGRLQGLLTAALLAVGVAIMYAGFVAAGRPTRRGALLPSAAASQAGDAERRPAAVAGTDPARR